jgi:hypothetical protein
MKEEFISYYESGYIPKDFWNNFIKVNRLNPCLCRLSAVVKWIWINWEYRVSKELIASRLGRRRR